MVLELGKRLSQRLLERITHSHAGRFTQIISYGNRLIDGLVPIVPSDREDAFLRKNFGRGLIVYDTGQAVCVVRFNPNLGSAGIQVISNNLIFNGQESLRDNGEYQQTNLPADGILYMSPSSLYHKAMCLFIGSLNKNSLTVHVNFNPQPRPTHIDFDQSATITL